MQLGFIVVLVIAIFVAIFAIQNGALVTLDLFLIEVSVPLAVVIMVCIILGAIIILLLGTYRQFKKSSKVKELNKKIKVFESDKAQFENNIKLLETEVQSLKDNNNALISKISELESRNKEQEEIILKIKQGENNESLTGTLNDNSDIDNEKSETDY